MSTAATPYALHTQGLSKLYPGAKAPAVDGIDLAIPPGCRCGFLGKNGAGKTTTLRMLAGLKRPTAGSIHIMGQPQVFGQDALLPFGYLPDVPQFYGYMTGQEFLLFCGKLAGLDAAQRQQRATTLLAQVGLAKTRQRIAAYSRGMKQRLGIAQALVNNPGVIFMDEPISALDPMGRRDVAEIIRGLTDTTVVFSTHILADIEDICDFVLIIEKGKLLAQDTLANLKARFTQNKAEVTFYAEAEAAQFVAQAPSAGLVAQRTGSPLTVDVFPGEKNNDPGTLVLRAGAVLCEYSLPFAGLAAHSPSLEDIFQEVLHG